MQLIFLTFSLVFSEYTYDKSTQTFTIIDVPIVTKAWVLNNSPSGDILEIVFTGDTRSIEGGAFSSSRFNSVKTFNFSSLYTLDDYVFGTNFRNVEDIIFGNQIKYIGDNFATSKDISHINFPASVERIHPRFIKYLRSFSLDKGNKHYAMCKNDDQFLLYPNQSLIYAVGGSYGKSFDLKIPDCIKTLDTINPEYESIDSSYDMTISEIDLNKVETLKGNWYNRCRVPDTITLPPSLKTIEPFAIPPEINIIELDDNTNFAYQNFGLCKCLVDVNRKQIIVIYRYGNSFQVPKEYKLSSGVVYKVEERTIPHVHIDTEVIPPYLFGKCNGYFTAIMASNLQLGENVKEIGEYAFSCLRTSTINSTFPIDIMPDRAFYCTISKLNLDDNPVRIELSATKIGKSCFASSSGLGYVTLTGKNITIDDEAFKDCEDLWEIKLTEGAYIGYLGDKVFDQDSRLKPINLSDKLVYVGEQPFPPRQFEEGHRFIISGTTILYHGGYVDSVFDFNNITKICKNGMNDISTGCVLRFPAVEEIEPYTFYKKSLVAIHLGKKYTKIREKTFEGASIKEFYLDAANIDLLYDNALTISTKKFVAGKINTNGYISTITFTQNPMEDINFDGSIYKFTNDLLTLDSKKYSGNYVSIPEAFCKIHITSNVEIIDDNVLFESYFKEITIDEGLKVFDTVIMPTGYSFPLSIRNVSLHLFKFPIKLHKDTPLMYIDDSFLISEDSTTLISTYQLSSLNDLVPNVRILGTKSLYGVTKSYVDIPNFVETIEYNAFDMQIGVTEESELRVLKYQPNASHYFSYVPKHIVEIDIDFLLWNKEIKFSPELRAFKVKNGVQYYQGTYAGKKASVALNITDHTRTSINLDFDYIAPMVKIGLNVTQLKFTSRVKNSLMGQVVNPRIAHKIPELHQYQSGIFRYTCFSGPLHMGMKVVKDERGEFSYSYPILLTSIPSTVTHIYFNIDKNNPGPKFTFHYSPWIHVPNNMGLEPSDFDGQPLIYDMGNFVPPALADSGLSTGAIVGIAVGSIAVVGIIAGVVVFFCCCRKKKEVNNEASSSSSSSNNV